MTAKNAGGSVSSTVAVTVEARAAEAPSLAEMPKPQHVKAGETLTLSCKIKGQYADDKLRIILTPSPRCLVQQ